MALNSENKEPKNDDHGESRRTVLSCAKAIFFRDGKTTTATHALLAVSIVVGGVTVIRPAFWVPSPMRFCEAMVERGLVRDCERDETPPEGASTSIQFRVTSSGRTGRVVKFSGTDQYRRELHSQERLRELNEMLIMPFPGDYPLIIFVPGPFDAVERHLFSQFHNEDMERVTKRQALERWESVEHPVHSEACMHAPACAEEGRCSIIPSNPDECIGGFDKDCMASTRCRVTRHCVATSIPDYGCY